MCIIDKYKNIVCNNQADNNLNNGFKMASNILSMHFWKFSVDALFKWVPNSDSNIGPSSINNFASVSIAFLIIDFNDCPCGDNSLKNGPAATIKFKLPVYNIKH